ncbi:MAG: hypothetical protein N2037_06810 [Acidimicrobiales bacterium]|nr:hypothetical protein [Acidimicrobiales bacterium]
MSDISQGPGWWQAADGKWYPPKESEQPPAPGWWLAADGKWYPPADEAPAPGWWLAADGKWYPPVNQAGTASVPGTSVGSRPAPAAPAPDAAPPPAPAKPVAAKLAPAKPVPAVPVAAKPAPAKPVAAKSAPAKPAKSASTETAPPMADPLVRHTAGMTPEDQIAIRDAASRQDAQVLAPARAAAALRALKSLGAEIQTASTPSDKTAVRTASPATASPASTKAGSETSAGDTPAVSGPSSPSSTGSQASPPAHDVAPTSPNTDQGRAQTGDREPETPTGALLEVKPSPLSTDIDRIGERLVIFNDRVELRDRNDRVRQVIKGDDITDVVVHRKFTGAWVTVESLDGTSIVAKGLRPDQAEEIRTIIQRRTRQARPAPKDRPKPTVALGTEPTPAKSATPTRIDAEELIAKLVDLHEAGILTTEELETKKALVARLAASEPLATTPG